MRENLTVKDIINKKNIFRFFKNIGFFFLIISPILIFFLSTYLYQLSIPDAKDPFIQFSGLDPKTEAYVTWETEKKESSTVWYGNDSSNLDLNETNAEEVTIHRLKISDLEPNTKYYYKVGVDGSDPIYRSDIFSFTTAPNDTATDFNFAIYSDSQIFYGIGWHRRICEAIAQFDDLSFVSIAGDLAQNWDYKPDWNQFFYDSTLYLRKYPIVPIMGNHDGYYPEEDPNAELHWYETYFGATNTTSDPHSFYYAFNWSNTLFVMAEISKGGDENPDTPRNKAHDVWLNRTLAMAQDKAFRILIFHRQVFSAEADNPTLINRIVPIVEKYNVSLVMYGHHHHYERFLHNDHTYICLGGGGSPQFGSNYFNPGEETQVFAMGPSYTKFSITSDTISGTTFTPENDILDSFNLKLEGSEAILQE